MIRQTQEARQTYKLADAAQALEDKGLAPIIHDLAIAQLAEEAEAVRAVERALAGAIVTEELKTARLGVAEFKLTRKRQTYRIDEALIQDPQAGDNSDAQWVTLRGNSSLEHLLRKHRSDLLVFEANRESISFELLIFKIYTSKKDTVRILLRRKDGTA